MWDAVRRSLPCIERGALEGGRGGEEHEEVEELWLGGVAGAGGRAGRRCLRAGGVVRRATRPAQQPGGIEAGRCTTARRSHGSYAGGDELIASAAQSLVNGRNDVPLRHVRRRGVLGRRAQAAPGDRGQRERRRRRRRQPEDGARGRAQGRRRAAPARRRGRHQGGHGRSRRSGDDAGAAQAERGRRRDRLLRPATAGCASMGIQCALCHSTVDDSFAPGIGKRLDGWPNRDLNVGAIIVAGARSVAVRPTLLRRRRGDGAEGAGSLGAGQVRRRADPGRQGIPSRRQDGGDAAAGGVRPGRRQPAHLHGLGLGHALERVRREPRDDGQGHVLRPAAERRDEVPGRRARRIRRTSRKTPDLDHAASSPTCTSTSSRSRRRRRRPGSFDADAAARGKALFNGNGALRRVPRAADVQRAGLADAHRRGDRHRRLPGQAFARRALPHDAARRPAHARRRAASITTVASRRWPTSSTTTTRSSA